MRAMLMMMALTMALTASHATAQSASGASDAKATASLDSQVNLNTATSAQLETLPGIGPATAQRILEYRQKNGGFKKVEELMNIRGVGEKSFLKLKPLVSVTMAKGERASAQ